MTLKFKISKYMKKGLSWMGVRRILGYIFYILPNWAIFFILQHKWVLFGYAKVIRPVCHFCGQKYPFFLVKNSIFYRFGHNWPKNGCFWSKKWPTGLLTLEYPKSTHLCCNIKKISLIKQKIKKNVQKSWHSHP